MLILPFATIFPTWVMFRYSPRHSRHTLPEGFFIQVLFATLMVSLFLLMVPCWFIFKQITVLSVIFVVVTLYYIIGYRQLFGYGLWGTVWRLLFVFGFVYCVALLLAHLAFYLGLTRDIHLAEYTLPAKIFMPSFYVFFGVLILGMGYLINRIATRRSRPQQQL